MKYFSNYAMLYIGAAHEPEQCANVCVWLVFGNLFANYRTTEQPNNYSIREHQPNTNNKNYVCVQLHRTFVMDTECNMPFARSLSIGFIIEIRQKLPKN